MVSTDYSQIISELFIKIKIDSKKNDHQFEIIGNTNSISTIAKKINTIPYEILTSLGKRYQRRYISN